MTEGGLIGLTCKGVIARRALWRPWRLRRTRSQCNEYLWFASNHFSSWREQTENEWHANTELLSWYEEVEPLEPGTWPRDPEARAKALAEAHAKELAE